MSSEPASRSSVAPTGSSASVTGRSWDVALSWDAALSWGAAGHWGSGAAGSQEYGQPETTRTGGSNAARPRTMVDFAVPFSPRTRTPPMAGDTALSSSASFRSAIPTMPANGYALSVVATEPVLPGFPRPKWKLIGSRSLWLPVETATSRVTPGHSCGTAPDSHRRSSASLPQHSMTYPPDAVPDSTGLPAGYTSPGPKSFLSSPGAHVASHSADNSQLTRVA